MCRVEKCFYYDQNVLKLSLLRFVLLSVQSPFTSTPYLEMDFEANILPPGAMMEVPVKFHPCEARHYHDRLPFILNSSITKYVDIQGQGVEMKVSVKTCVSSINIVMLKALDL